MYINTLWVLFFCFVMYFIFDILNKKIDNVDRKINNINRWLDRFEEDYYKNYDEVRYVIEKNSFMQERVNQYLESEIYNVIRDGSESPLKPYESKLYSIISTARLQFIQENKEYYKELKKERDLNFKENLEEIWHIPISTI